MSHRALIRILLVSLFASSNTNDGVVSSMSIIVVPSGPTRPSTTRTIATHHPGEATTDGRGTHHRNDNRRHRLRIRRTKVGDVDAVSDMLVESSMSSSSSSLSEGRSRYGDWNDGMRRLRIKSDLTKQLHLRLDALVAGRHAVRRWGEERRRYAYDDRACSSTSEREFDDDEYGDARRRRLLWNDDVFRTKVRRAARHSHEDNVWRHHDFDVVPEMEMLHHVMLSAVIVDSSSYSSRAKGGKGNEEVVVGFCEVAYLPHPPTAGRTTMNDSTISISSYAPTIINLVTSSSYRRMGIASRVLRFASRYTSTRWRGSRHYGREDDDCDLRAGSELGLYVHHENECALRLYAKEGYAAISSDVDNGLTYMRLGRVRGEQSP
jgi:ribosomal protein S18 acetylase RimI-like enzyme